jgi:hypothetical protein
MANYLKNFLFKLLLLPVIALLGATMLLVFLFAPHFKLLKTKKIRSQITEY